MQLFDKNGNDITASFLYQPNLLDNADFRNFINQRKKTTYIGIASNRVYTGDRWSIYGEGQTVNIKDTYVEFINDSAPGNLLQYLEFPLIEREIYTISANINGNIVKKNITGGTYDTNENLMYGSNGTYEYIAIHTDIGATNKLYWCKLEQGSIATPLVPRPRAVELMLCQRYCQKIECLAICNNFESGTWYMIGVPFTTSMRINPTIESYSVLDTGFGSANVSISDSYIDTDGVYKIILDSIGEKSMYFFKLLLSAEIY